MDRNGFLTVFVFIFIVAEASNASLLSKHRILIGEPQNDSSTVPGKDSPVPSPPPPPPSPPPPVSSSGGNRSVPMADDDPSKNKTDTLPPAKTPKADPGPRGLNNNTKTDEGKDPNKEKKDPNPTPDTESKKDPNPVPATTPKQDPNSKQLKDEPNSASAPPEGGKVKNKEDSPEGGKVKNKKDSPEGGKVKSKEIEKEKNDNVNNSQNADRESCDGIIKRCQIKDVVVACIKSFDSGSKEVVILVQNIGDSTLKAKVSAENTKMDLKIAKHKNEKVTISLDIDRSTKITLNTANGECELHMDPPVSDGNFFLRLPSYEKVVTPINGAYFLIVTVLIFGGTWAFCKARKRKQRTGGGVPYQELEMGLPESVSATAVETAEGWDQGWDDDWDGDNAVKSPGAHLVGSISANGLTSRSANKDGWENDWDD
ncbi:PREDICTED: partial [Prunus dulcis]|uniref:PREDICTED: partial n=2 Tax=Prunus dulcis TaxID=3755 RepID=A0A5E4EF56_PRUDU|nr:protein TonB isoform X1 [Prunus dulcis]VVA14427.1 PREDICTED: partial [Prunus dulcis]